jgi:hypothetical protein
MDEKIGLWYPEICLVPSTDAVIISNQFGLSCRLLDLFFLDFKVPRDKQVSPGQI